jgi:hypothetical protein
MKSMKYKIGPFELNNKKNQVDETHIVLKNKPHIFKKIDHYSNQKKAFYNQNDPPIEMRINYDADIDELNEIVISEPVKSVNSNVCVNIKRNFTKSNTSLSTISSASLTPIKNSKVETRVDNNSPNVDSISSSESGFGTTGDEENEIQHPNISAQTIQTVPENQCQPFPQEQRKPEFVSQQQHLDLNQLKNLNSLPIIHPPNRQIIFSGLSNSSNKNNSDDVVKILTNDSSSLNSSVYSSNSSNNNRAFRCCSSIFNSLIKFYYSCFCCYSTTSHTNQTPLIWSWLSVFCCCCPLLGGISLFLSHRSKVYKRKQNYDLADKYSKYAECTNIAALIFGVIFYAIAFFLITLVIFMYWRPHNS